MSGQLNIQGIKAPDAVPGPQETVECLLEEYPELGPSIAGFTAWRDQFQPDRKSRGFERQFPAFRPNPY